MRLSRWLVAIAVCGSTPVLAGTPSLPDQGLGSAQPGAPNVSQSPGWRVYRYWKDGIEYLQVNDISGNVHAGFGTANGLLVVLPMGVDATRVSTPSAPLATPVSLSQMVYQDAQVAVQMGVDASGQTIWAVTPKSAIGTATPAAQGVTTSKSATASGTCDPNDCGINRVTNP